MGPLSQIRVIEMEGLGPCPFAGMMLADLGAEVIRVGRAKPPVLQTAIDVFDRGKQSVVLDLKGPASKKALLKLVEGADVLLEGFRPGVMERLGIGPETCLEINPRLVYGRMTGWGQEGPLSQRAGHDINYISIAGALHCIGRKGQKPTVPLNLVADFGGGGLLLAFGVLAALLERQHSGKGDVVDAAMVDGAGTLMASIFAALQAGFFSEKRGENILDGGAPFYDTYETKDGKFVSVGALEPQFYQILIEKLGLQGSAPPPFAHMQAIHWEALRPKMEEIFLTRTRDEWCEIFDETDACVAPILSPTEAFEHPHNVARKSFVDVGGSRQPRPAPRFARTDPPTPNPPHELGADTQSVLRGLGISEEDVAAVLRS
ncbi:MAG: CoA transferase [Deltaproteobacteria bacterium]|nr:CoA transferase [Deltaproteobacteria bacterium]